MEDNSTMTPHPPFTATDAEERTTMGQRLRQMRTIRQWTLQDVRDRSGVALSYIRRLENEGDWEGASLGVIAKLAKAFGVSPADLIGRDYLDAR